MRAREIGAAIRAARLRMGITQAELARRMGTTQQAISHIERYGTKRTDSLVRYARFLNAQFLVG